jgi:sugar lactone lactonase YvrE
MYVVEDARNGRLIRLSPDGQTTVLAENLRSPESVVVAELGERTASPTLYVTESNVQSVRQPYQLETAIVAIGEGGEQTTVVSHSPRLRGLDVAFWSYAGLANGPDGLLYVTNELSGRELERDVTLFSGRLVHTFKILTRESIFAIDPASGARTLVAEDLLAPEGLSFSADGDFPLYVAEENEGSRGRLSRVEQDGRRTTVCEGFFGIEDVTVDAEGTLYVSEDGSGYVIRIAVPEDLDVSASLPLEPRSVDLLPQEDRLWRGINRVFALLKRLGDTLNLYLG